MKPRLKIFNFEVRRTTEAPSYVSFGTFDNRQAAMDALGHCKQVSPESADQFYIARNWLD